VAVAPDAEVSVKVHAPASIKRGARLVYTIKVKNRGPSSAWQVKLKDVLPQKTEFERVKARHCSVPRIGHKGGKVTCRLGTIRAGHSAVIRIVVKAGGSVGHGAIIDTASVSSVTPDPHNGNNSDRLQIKVK
jgi:virginiamycin B lyase